ncbi:MAG: lysophospholipid acyltransferase family protein [bacterium]
MRISPTTEQWQTLKFIERVNFKVTDFINRSHWLRRPLIKIQSTFSKSWIELVTSRIVKDHGFENFKKIDPSRAVLLVANHRSFFDQFVITARLFQLYGAHHHIYFPIRANFFYDNPLALLVNLTVTLGVMYPPFVREGKRRQWNLYAMDLLVDILSHPDNFVGFHPEGTRNQSPDPYALLPGKPGCGELIYRARPNVVPVFLQGFPSSVWKMLRQNLSFNQETEPVVHMVMGEPMKFDEELNFTPSRKTYLSLSKKVMTRIQQLGEEERKIRARYAKSH